MAKRAPTAIGQAAATGPAVKASTVSAAPALGHGASTAAEDAPPLAPSGEPQEAPAGLASTAEPAPIQRTVQAETSSFVAVAQPVVAAAAPTASDPPVSASQTVANLSAQIVQRADQKTSRFDVQLTPDGLGRVDVAVEIDAQGKVTAALSFEKAESASLVKNNAGDMQAALASAGLNLSVADLKISHAGADASSAQASAAAQQVIAPANASTDAGGAGGQPGQSPAQHFAAGGQSFSQQQQQGQGQSDRPQSPAFGGARSFETAATAADVVDRQAAYRAGVNTRGLDIRI